jgi:mono/diheme cytochrome c family protein
MDVGMLHSHHLVVVLYLLLIVAGLGVMILRRAALEAFNKRARIGHMVLGSLMLLTGGYLAVKSPLGFSGLALVKYVLLLAAIGLAVVGLRRLKAALVAGSIVVLLYVYGISKTDSLMLTPVADRMEKAWQATAMLPTTEKGKVLYTVGCVACHGANGKAGYLKSKDLTASRVDSSYIAALLKNGKGLMPAYGSLSDAQHAALVEYVQSLRN